MALPKEPRQKMINIMYLVLTALLALNVSAEILNAFKIVDNSLTGTNSTINRSTNTIMASLQSLMSDASKAEKAKYWYDKAQRVQAISATAYNDIQSFKDEILKAADFDPKKKGDSSFNQGNQDIPTRIMVEHGGGKKLYAILDKYKKDILAVDPLLGKEFGDASPNPLQIDLSMPKVLNKNNKTWEEAYFHMVPTVAAVTILSKFQNDVKTSENKVVAFCHQQVGQVEVKFDAFEAIVGQNSKYLMPGQQLEITAGLGAFSKTKLPTITIGGAGVKPGENGMASYKMDAGGIGNHTVPVVVSFLDQDGKLQTKTTNIEYTVGQANASIALDKMNVLYIGVDNPVSIAASGGGDDKVQVSMSGGGGSISKVGVGKYNVRVNSVTDDAKITVSVDGKVAGVSQFRVRTIPDPVATIGGEPSGTNVSKNQMIAQSAVSAWVQNFPFDLTYRVVSYTIVADTDEDPIQVDVQGNLFSSQVQSALRKVRSGGILSVENIRAMGPDGRTRKLPSIFYNIK